MFTIQVVPFQIQVKRQSSKRDVVSSSPTMCQKNHHVTDAFVACRTVSLRRQRIKSSVTFT